MHDQKRYVNSNFILRRYHLRRLTIVADTIRHISEIKRERPLVLADIGCGDGTYELLLERHFDYLIGLDVAAEEMKTTKKSTKNKSKVDFILADAKHLPFRSLSVDILVCSEVLEHLHKPMETLEELLRVCNGAILITVPVLNITRRIRLIRHLSKLNQIETQVGHVSMGEWSSWIMMVRKLMKNRTPKCDVAITHVYVSSEPFTSMFANYRNKIVLRILDKTLNMIEKALSNSVFANHLMITLTQ